MSDAYPDASGAASFNRVTCLAAVGANRLHQTGGANLSSARLGEKGRPIQEVIDAGSKLLFAAQMC